MRSWPHHLSAEAKRYIAENDIQLYTINAIDLAQQIGMGKRTNTILQSAFFTLAKVMPQEEAIQYMKDAATKSYLKKGQDIVDMNHKAIDLGATAFKKYDVPADWKNAKDEVKVSKHTGPAKLVDMVNSILGPRGPYGWRQPACFRLSCPMRMAPSSWAPPPTRSAAWLPPPTWDSPKRIQCNQCSYVCPHATIRPFALTERRPPRPCFRQDRGREGRQGQGSVQALHRHQPPGLCGLRACAPTSHQRP